MVMNDYMSKKIMVGICVNFLQLRPFNLDQRCMQALLLALFKQVKLRQTLLGLRLDSLCCSNGVPGQYPCFRTFIVFRMKVHL